MFTRAGTAGFPSQIEHQKTNEARFRRLKRLQQVRSQSKERAREVRQRADGERQRQLEQLAQNRHEDYIARQERVVTRLDQLTAGSFGAVGLAHTEAARLSEDANSQLKPPDHSKERAKIAANELRRLKNEELEKKNKQLNRKLIARTQANERSRQKLKKSLGVNTPAVDTEENTLKPTTSADPEQPVPADNVARVEENHTENADPANKKDEETQWSDSIGAPKTYDNIPKINRITIDSTEKNGYKTRRNLFAVSEGMPEDLLGNIFRAPRPAVTESQSLTIVSDFISTRDHRLRKPAPEFHHVNAEEVLGLRNVLNKSPVTRARSPPRTSKPSQPATTSGVSSTVVNAKRSIQNYDHTTKTCKEIPLENDNLVQKVTEKDKDAYTQAVQESEQCMRVSETVHDEAEQQRLRDAAERQKIAKEYRETMEYLKRITKSADNVKKTDCSRVHRHEELMKKHHHQKSHEDFARQPASKPKATCISDPIPVQIPIKSHCSRRKSTLMSHDSNGVTVLAGTTLDEAEKLLHQVQRTLSTREHAKQNEKEKSSVKFDFTPSTYTYVPALKHTPPTKDRPEINQHRIDESRSNGNNDTNGSEENTSEGSVISHGNSDSNGVGPQSGIQSRRSKPAVQKFIVYQINDPSEEEALKSAKAKHKCRKSKAHKKEKEKQQNTVTEGTKLQEKSSEPTEKSKKEITSQNDKPAAPAAESHTGVSEKTSPGKQKKSDSVRTSVGLESERSAPSGIPTQQPTSSSAAVTTETAATPSTVTRNHAKILNDNSGGSGRFFFGVSNLPRDNPYEVVIQIKNPIVKPAVPTVEIRSKDLPQPQELNEEQNIPQYSNRDQQKLSSPKQTSLLANVQSKTPVCNAQFSSSSSTLYMSPPDIILPKLLRPHHHFGRSVTHSSSGNTNTNFESECNRYIRPENEKRKMSPHKRHHKNLAVKTSKTCHKFGLKKHSKIHKDYSHNGHKHKCDENICKNTHGGNQEAEQSYRKTEKQRKEKEAIDIEKLLYEIIKCDSEKFKHTSKSRSKPIPLIQKYINDFLQMSDDDSRRAKMSALQCSTVSTPGSSVINISTNMYANKLIDHKNTLGKGSIKDLLTRTLISHLRKHEHYNHQPATKCSKQNQSNSVMSPNSGHSHGVFRIKKHNIKCKPIHKHKVKSLNISKNISKYFKFVGPKEQGNSVSNNNANIKETADNNIDIETEKELIRNVIEKVEKPHLNDSLKSASHDYHTQKSNTRSRVISNSNAQDVVSKDKELKKNIEHLTEKCTKKLSNLSKVLDEVRKNKSNMYHETYKTAGEHSPENEANLPVSPENKHKTTKPNISARTITDDTAKVNQDESNLEQEEDGHFKSEQMFVPILADIPKPDKYSESEDTPKAIQTSVVTDPKKTPLKSKSRPPPALFRANLKSTDNVVPHELSTVLEVDSPASLRNSSSRTRGKISSPAGKNFANTIQSNDKSKTLPYCHNDEHDKPANQSCILVKPTVCKGDQHPTQLESSVPSPHVHAPQLTASADRIDKMVKIKMFDKAGKQESILKPFISIDEYARQCMISHLEEPSNIDEGKEQIKSPNNEGEVSSLNSDATLPDIISELIQRKLISKPFNFDSGSNLDSNGMSSDSSRSLKASSDIKQHKDDPKNKEAGTSEKRMPDESRKNDFEKSLQELGMGWASSTLKKTKETLALSSSTSMSSIELSGNRKCSKKAEPLMRKLPKRVVKNTSTSRTHSTAIEWIETSFAKTPENKENMIDLSKEIRKRMFLQKSLPDKTLFSSRPNEEEHFTSLYSTKLNIDNSECENESQVILDNDISNQNQRQRTSTPVQLFKTLSYNSSTSSCNISNGLFSNVDDISSVKNRSTSDKDELTVPSISLRLKKSRSESSNS